MPYTTTTLAQATIDVAARLGDPGFVRWTQDELADLVKEALRTWNAYTSHFRDQDVFNTKENEAFYDLSIAIPKLMGYNVTDADLVKQIQRHLLEPVDVQTWVGSDQFTMQDVISAIQRRRDQFLLETGMVLHHQKNTIAPPPDGRIYLDESIITVRRAAWQLTTGQVIPLQRDDVWSFNAYFPAWVQGPNRPDVEPASFSVGETPPLVMQIVPPPQDTGRLDLVVIDRGPLLNPSATPNGVLLGIPDDWTWVVKFGALADLLSKDGLAMDPARAQYCEARWTQGIALAKTYSSVWSVRVNNVVVPLDSVQQADNFLSTWQTGTGQPNLALLAKNLVALTPVPDKPGIDIDYGVTVDVVRNAPMPPSLTDFLEVGPELLDALYQYVEHLAVLKEGAPLLETTKPLLDNFLRLGNVSVAIDWAQTPNRKALTDQTDRDEQQTERMQEMTQ